MIFPATHSLLLGPQAITKASELLRKQGRLRPLLISDANSKLVVRAFKRQVKGKAWIRAEYVLAPTPLAPLAALATPVASEGKAPLGAPLSLESETSTSMATSNKVAQKSATSKAAQEAAALMQGVTQAEKDAKSLQPQLTEPGKEAREAYKQHQCDAIIVIGKEAAIHLGALLQEVLISSEEVEPYLLLIPTLPGTGEELHPRRWLYDVHETIHTVQPAKNTCMVAPRTVIYDTTFLLTLSDVELATLAMYNLGLALDTLIFAQDTHTYKAEHLLIEAVRSIFANLYRALDTPKEPTFRTKLLEGFALIQQASTTKAGSSEILSRTITMHTAIPAGMSIIPILAQLVALKSNNDTTTARVANMFAEIPGLGDEDIKNPVVRLEKALSQLTEGLYRKCGQQFPIALGELQRGAHEKPESLRLVAGQLQPHQLNPRQFEAIIKQAQSLGVGLSEDRLARILMAIYWGYLLA